MLSPRLSLSPQLSGSHSRPVGLLWTHPASGAPFGMTYQFRAERLGTTVTWLVNVSDPDQARLLLSEEIGSAWTISEGEKLDDAKLQALGLQPGEIVELYREYKAP